LKQVGYICVLYVASDGRTFVANSNVVSLALIKSEYHEILKFKIFFFIEVSDMKLNWINV
jgi:hypothetical protein